MVRGLELFRDRFAAYAGAYILIGGAASDLVMDNAGLPFRATKDLDIVLCVEALDDAFVEEFWSFVQDGEYEVRERTGGPRMYYRFQRPTNEAYPAMLELFSRKPDAIHAPEGAHLTPLPTDSDVSSLSAILLDETYYAWIVAGRREVEGVPIVGAEHLIPLKAKAFLELSERRSAGERVDSSDVKKHKKDVIRLAQTLAMEAIPNVPEKASADVAAFIKALRSEGMDVNGLNVVFSSLDEVTNLLDVAYALPKHDRDG